MNSDCMLCQLKSISRHIKTVSISETDRLEIIREFLAYLSSVDKNTTNPEMAAQLNRLIAAHHPEKEIYRREKEKFNQAMLDLYDTWHHKATQSDNPLHTAMKLAIAGNIIDFGPDHEFNAEDVINSVLESDLAVDDSNDMFDDISKAKNILYLADNAGEIVMDRLFISLISHPGLKVAVRGKPVLNDVVMEDARYVGIDKLVPVINNGTDIPSTVLKKCSPEFMEAYNKADLIISKGQGNLEGLISERDKNIYFLFTVKCDAIAKLTSTQKGNFVVMHAHRLPDCSKEPCL
ncbi:MAG: damage-control phosphatase ARMT1 family protein [Bacteroidales bacterium]